MHDIVIIGGGIAGISLAARLAPFASVTVLEREPSLGYHSTSRSAAMYIPNYGTALLRQLILQSGDDLTGDHIVAGGVTSMRGELAIVGADDEDILAKYMTGSTGLTSYHRTKPMISARFCAMTGLFPRFMMNRPLILTLISYFRALSAWRGNPVLNF